MANDPKQVVAFSSRGPTTDGRFKPEVVAPGTFILSTRSRMLPLNNTAWAPFQPSRLYFHMGGTSMACPLAAGAVAVVREYLRTEQGIANPSAALLKAALIAGAVRLSGYGERGAVVDDEQGFGRLDLDGVLAPGGAASSRFLEIRPGLRTGKVHSQDLQVKSKAQPLRVALAYSDFPGPALVNDLNLIVTAPDGTKTAGNQRRGGAGTLDARNNAELVHVAKPAAGKWTVEVVGSNVPEGPQEVALVAIGPL
jgi:subtilisin family serine protease